MHLSSLPYVPHAPPNSYSLILSPQQYWGSSEDHGVGRLLGRDALSLTQCFPTFRDSALPVSSKVGGCKMVILEVLNTETLRHIPEDSNRKAPWKKN